jgi:hypothetical protein
MGFLFHDAEIARKVQRYLIEQRSSRKVQREQIPAARIFRQQWVVGKYPRLVWVNPHPPRHSGNVA